MLENTHILNFQVILLGCPRECKWKPRQRGDVVGRLIEVHPTGGDLFFLRMLLLRKKGCCSFEDLRTVRGVLYDTSKETCEAIVHQNDNQWHEAMIENSHCSLAKELRKMFVNILAYSQISDPLMLWNSHWKCMSDDIILTRRRLTGYYNLNLFDFDLKNNSLAGVED